MAGSRAWRNCIRSGPGRRPRPALARSGQRSLRRDRHRGGAGDGGGPSPLLPARDPPRDRPARASTSTPTLFMPAARENLERFIREIPFTEEAEPALFVYRLRMDGRDADRRGRLLRGGRVRRRPHPQARADAPGQGRRPHPPRRRDAAPGGARSSWPTASAGRHRRAGGRGRRATPPLYDFTAADGVSHTVWRVTQPADLRGRVRAGPAPLRRRRPPSGGVGRPRPRALQGRGTRATPATRSTTACWPSLFPASQLRILPYNRVVTDLGGRSAGASSWPRSGALPGLAGRRPEPRAPRRLPGLRRRRGRRRAGTASASSRGRGPPSSTPSTSACCRTRCWRRCSASTIPAPTSASTSSAASAGPRELEKRVRDGRAAVGVLPVPDLARRSSWRWPTRARSCRPSPPGSSPSSAPGSFFIGSEHARPDRRQVPGRRPRGPARRGLRRRYEPEREGRGPDRRGARLAAPTS